MILQREANAPKSAVVDLNEMIFCQPMAISDMVRVGEPLGANTHPKSCGFAWVPKHLWSAIEDFQRPMPAFPPNFPIRDFVDQMAATVRYDEVPFAAEVDRKLRLNPDHGVLWFFYGIHPETNERVELITVLGEERLTRWSWFEAAVGFPLVMFFARILRAVRRVIRYRKS